VRHEVHGHSILVLEEFGPRRSKNGPDLGSNQDMSLRSILVADAYVIEL